MLSEQRLNQIQKMEKILNQAEPLLTKMEALQQEWQALAPEINQLFDYYFYGDWRQDYDAYDKGEIPPDMPCGVLSEDAVYNLSVQYHEILDGWKEVISSSKNEND